jgi:MraZ protein
VVSCVTKGCVVNEDDTVLDKEIAGQSVFVSRFTHNLDPKRRLTIPSNWRTQVGEPKSLYVLPHIHECCLSVIPAAVMVDRIRKMREHSIADRKARQFARVLASQSDLVSWDAQGRIRVKDELLELAQIKERAVLVGAFDSFELWSEENFEESVGMDRASLQEAAEYVGL